MRLDSWIIRERRTSWDGGGELWDESMKLSWNDRLAVDQRQTDVPCGWSSLTIVPFVLIVLIVLSTRTCFLDTYPHVPSKRENL